MHELQPPTLFKPPKQYLLVCPLLAQFTSVHKIGINGLACVSRATLCEWNYSLPNPGPCIQIASAQTMGIQGMGAGQRPSMALSGKTAIILNVAKANLRTEFQKLRAWKGVRHEWQKQELAQHLLSSSICHYIPVTVNVSSAFLFPFLSSPALKARALQSTSYTALMQGELPRGGHAAASLSSILLAVKVLVCESERVIAAVVV